MMALEIEEFSFRFKEINLKAYNGKIKFFYFHFFFHLISIRNGWNKWKLENLL